MQAAGDHVLVLQPEKDTTTKGGIVLHEESQQLHYGLVVSVGPHVKQTDLLNKIVVFDKSGFQHLEFDTLSDEGRGIIPLVEDMVFASFTIEEAKKRGLKIPDASEAVHAS